MIDVCKASAVGVHDQFIQGLARDDGCRDGCGRVVAVGDQGDGSCGGRFIGSSGRGEGGEDAKQLLEFLDALRPVVSERVRRIRLLVVHQFLGAVVAPDQRFDDQRAVR